MRAMLRRVVDRRTTRALKNAQHHLHQERVGRNDFELLLQIGKHLVVQDQEVVSRTQPVVFGHGAELNEPRILRGQPCIHHLMRGEGGVSACVRARA